MFRFLIILNVFFLNRLDSASALMVGKILQRLCAKGITILCTIHQPRYALATMFDKVYFLAKGQEIYFGPTVPHCLSFFENAGYKLSTILFYFIVVLNKEQHLTKNKKKKTKKQ